MEKKIPRFGRISVRLSGNKENRLPHSVLIMFVEPQHGNIYRYVSLVARSTENVCNIPLNSSNKTTFITIIRPAEARERFFIKERGGINM